MLSVTASIGSLLRTQGPPRNLPDIVGALPHLRRPVSDEQDAAHKSKIDDTGSPERSDPAAQPEWWHSAVIYRRRAIRRSAWIISCSRSVSVMHVLIARLLT
jgi:hypothetical protein